MTNIQVYDDTAERLEKLSDRCEATIAEIIDALLDEAEEDIVPWFVNEEKNESLKEDIDFTSFKKELKDTIPEKDIDTYQSDLYVRITPETTALIKKYGIDKHSMLSKFRDNIDHDMWYELPFVNMGEYIEKTRPKYESLKESRGGFVRGYKGCSIHDVGDTYVVTNEHGFNIGQSRTESGCEGIIDEYVKERYGREPITQEFIGLSISEARQKLGRWYVLDSQNTTFPRKATYTFKRSGYPSITLHTLNGKVNKVSGEIYDSENSDKYFNPLKKTESVSRKRKLKEARDYAKEDEDRKKFSDWLYNTNRLQSAWDFYFADEEGNDAEEILNTMIEDFLDKSFVKDEISEEEEEYWKRIARLTINDIAFYNFNKEESLQEGKEDRFEFWVKRYGKPGDVEVFTGEYETICDNLDNDESVDWYDNYKNYKTYDPQETVNESIKLGGGMSLPYDENWCIFVSSAKKKIFIRKVDSKKQFKEFENLGSFINVFESEQEAKNYIKYFEPDVQEFEVDLNESLTESLGNPTEEEIINVIVNECGYDREEAEQMVQFDDYNFYYGANSAADVAKDIYEQAYDDEYMIDHYFKDKEYAESIKEDVENTYPDEDIDSILEDIVEGDKENWKMNPRDIPNWIKEDFYDFDAMGQDLLAGNLYETSIGFIEIF